jgi:guanine nucleotide-binding protein subunit gamma
MSVMMAAAPYEIRTGGDGKSKKQSMAELKLRRLTELNQRLREDLERRRIPVSEAALEYAPPPRVALTRARLADQCTQPHCLHRQGAQGLDGPFTMGNGTLCWMPACMPSGHAANATMQIDKREDPYAPQQSNGCCIVM